MQKQRHPYPPTNLHEYQNKGLTKFAFRNSVILKGASLVVWDLAKVELADLKKKSGSKLPHSIVLYKVKYSMNYEIVKRDLRNNFMDMVPETNPRKTWS